MFDRLAGALEIHNAVGISVYMHGFSSLMFGNPRFSFDRSLSLLVI